MLILGLLLGAAMAGYLVLPPRVIGIAFPNLNQDMAIAPTPLRLAAYLAGRWIGFALLGLALGWLGAGTRLPLADRLAFAAALLWSIFMLLFLLTAHSPEFPLARALDPARLRLPLFPKGLISGFTLIAPNLLAMSWTFAIFPGKMGVYFFTNVFLGNAIFHLPQLLNIKWAKEVYFTAFLRVVIFCCAGLAMGISLIYLIKS